MVTITPNQQASVSYAAAGGQTMFNASCRAFPGYLSAFVVTVNGAACVYSPAPATNRQFSVVDNGAAVATIVFGAGLTGGDIVVIRRALPLERQTNLPETGPVSLAALNQELSRLVALVQDALANITVTAGGVGGIPDGNYGDIIASGAGTALNIGNGRVALSKITNLAASSILGNNTGVPGLPLELTGAQVTALLSVGTGDTGAGGAKGLVPAPAAGDAAAGKFLKADLTWGIPAGGGGGGGVTSSSLTFAATGGAAPGTNFNGSVARTIDFSTIGAAPLDSPHLTGIPLAPTAVLGTNSTQVATTAFVKAALDALINAAPGTMDTLKELADALGDDPNYAATTAAAIAGKANARPALPVQHTVSFAADDTHNNSHMDMGGVGQTLTLPNITAGTSFTMHFTTAWTLACAGGLSKNGANPAAVTTGTVSAWSIITFFHKGGGVWLVTGGGLA